MRMYVNAVLDILADRSAEELVGALLIAFALSLAVSGVYALARRKVTDRLMLMCSLTIVASMASMVLSVAYVRYAGERRRLRSGSSVLGNPTGRSMLARRIFDAADSDRDGRLSEDEAARAAAKFVRSLDADGKGTVDEDLVRNALRERLSSPELAPPGVRPARQAAAR